MSKHSKVAKPTAQRETPAPAPLAPVFGRWTNDTGRVFRDSIGGAPVPYWAPGDTKSIPEAHAEEARAKGLTRTR